MKKSKNRLVLNRETVHLLSRSSLSEVAGADPSINGAGGSCYGPCGTFRCPNTQNPDTRTFIGCV